MACLTFFLSSEETKGTRAFEEKTGKPESANRGEKAASTDERGITEELNWRALFVISASAYWQS